MLNHICYRALRSSSRPLASSMLSSPLFRRSFHPEPRSFHHSPHGTHRFVYRWIIQAIGTPLAVAYLCDKVSSSEQNGGGKEGFKLELELPGIDMGILTEPIRRAQSWT
ncbi:hypothetical protein A1O7_09689 [Cladophialophora yegresii CBS 114405]|uniref:Uncharacterized protein n=1 Tax=Cladophialophora yegresii CBS 114405 TaxID=1182544 RepID=W9VMY8_9EURO|nr:uncharacterized protein A1O7_09689 [Cladophialophora yegresii CBS 114405]EXJ54350.1 hypothetical protein A1O7_09689 [Cladophialophora yegresii CBS 114405]